MNVKTRRFVVARSRGAEGLACDSKVRSRKESTKEKNSSSPGGGRAARNSGLNSFPGGGRAARNSGLKSSFPGGGRTARNSGLCGGDGWEARDSGEAGHSSGLAGGEGGAGRSSGDGTATYNCLFDVKMYRVAHNFFQGFVFLLSERHQTCQGSYCCGGPPSSATCYAHNLIALRRSVLFGGKT
jgi:hypothetical protein